MTLVKKDLLQSGLKTFPTNTGIIIVAAPWRHKLTSMCAGVDYVTDDCTVEACGSYTAGLLKAFVSSILN